MRILFLNKRVLFPADTGGRIRTLNVLRHLCKWHDVTYLCSLQPGEDQALRQMDELGLRTETVPWREVPRGSLGFYRDVALNLLSRYPFNVNKDYDPALRAAAASLCATEQFDLVVCDFVQMARNVIGLPGPPRILFEHNVEAQIFERHASKDKGIVRRRLMAHQAAKMRRFEGMAGKQFQGVIAVSQADRLEFERRYGWQHVHTIDTSVDTEYFRPADHDSCPNEVVFVGSLDWLPNQDGIEWFVGQVWPLVMRQVPQARIRIVGRNPNAEMAASLALADQPAVEPPGQAWNSWVRFPIRAPTWRERLRWWCPCELAEARALRSSRPWPWARPWSVRRWVPRGWMCARGSIFCCTMTPSRWPGPWWTCCPMPARRGAWGWPGGVLWNRASPRWPSPASSSRFACRSREGWTVPAALARRCPARSRPLGRHLRE